MDARKGAEMFRKVHVPVSISSFTVEQYETLLTRKEDHGKIQPECSFSSMQKIFTKLIVHFYGYLKKKKTTHT